MFNAFMPLFTDNLFLLSKLQAKYQHVSRSPVGVSQLKVTPSSSSLGVFESKRSIKHKRWDSVLLVADDDQIAAETSEKSSGSVDSEVQVLAVNPSSLDSAAGNGQFQTNTVNESEPQTFNSSKGSTVSSDMKQETGSSPGSQGNPKRSPLTARERLRAARVLGRYTETTSSKPELGSKVLDALRASDGGKKKSGLPEAPTNLFDDSKRGLPKQGLTFEFPGGSDLFLIAFSFVFISTVMFATTYIVWKAGAIHFNEY